MFNPRIHSSVFSFSLSLLFLWVYYVQDGRPAATRGLLVKVLNSLVLVSLFLFDSVCFLFWFLLRARWTPHCLSLLFYALPASDLDLLFLFCSFLNSVYVCMILEVRVTRFISPSGMSFVWFSCF